MSKDVQINPKGPAFKSPYDSSHSGLLTGKNMKSLIYIYLGLQRSV